MVIPSIAQKREEMARRQGKKANHPGTTHTGTESSNQNADPSPEQTEDETVVTIRCDRRYRCEHCGKGPFKVSSIVQHFRGCVNAQQCHQVFIAKEQAGGRDLSEKEESIATKKAREHASDHQQKKKLRDGSRSTMQARKIKMKKDRLREEYIASHAPPNEAIFQAPPFFTSDSVDDCSPMVYTEEVDGMGFSQDTLRSYKDFLKGTKWYRKRRELMESDIVGLLDAIHPSVVPPR